MAAGNCAIGEGPPPPTLLTDWHCKKYNCLPEPGGLRDQSARDMELMSTLSTVYNSVKSWDSAQRSGNLQKWAAQNPTLNKVKNQWLDIKRNE